MINPRNGLRTEVSPVLYLLLTVLVLGFIVIVSFFFANGYLPEPFLSDKSDTFMDFYNPVYWTYKETRYLEWGSVYPPLNFLILKLISFCSLCETQLSAKAIRDSQSYTIMPFLFIYLAIPAVVVTREFWNVFTVKEKFILYSATIISTPMLFALERGNLILISLFFLSNIFSKVRAIRLASIALLVNIKPYFLLLFLIFIGKRCWRDFFACGLITSGVFFVSGVVLGGNFLAFFGNLFNYGISSSLYSIREILSLPSSLSAYWAALDYISIGDNISKLGFFFSNNLVNKQYISSIAQLGRVVQCLTILVATVGIVFKGKRLADWQISVLIIAIISNMGLVVGGYSLIFYLVCIPFFIRMKFNHIYLIVISLMAIYLDIFSLYTSKLPTVLWSYLGNKEISYFWSLSLGALIRPFLNFLLLSLLILELQFNLQWRIKTQFKL